MAGALEYAKSVSEHDKNCTRSIIKSICIASFNLGQFFELFGKKNMHILMEMETKVCLEFKKNQLS
jgi:hypothetical protein